VTNHKFSSGHVRAAPLETSQQFKLVQQTKKHTRTNKHSATELQDSEQVLLSEHARRLERSALVALLLKPNNEHLVCTKQPLRKLKLSEAIDLQSDQATETYFLQLHAQSMLRPSDHGVDGAAARHQCDRS
jgi:hypothetical protein